MSAQPPPPPPPRPRRFVIIAHRGDSASAPENTYASFELALSRGFPAFETDVQLTADGAAVLIHCEELGRTTGGAGRVDGAALAEVLALDAGAWFGDGAFAGERVPTLDGALRRFKGRAHIHLELKSQQPGLPAAVAALVKRHGWDRAPEHSAAAAATAAAEAPAAAAAAAAAGAAEPGPEGGVPRAAAASAAAPAEGEAARGGAAAAAAAAAQEEGDWPGAALGEVPGLTLTSFHLEQLRRSKELLPGVRHAWLLQEWGPEAAGAARGAPMEVLCPRANALTPEAVREMRAAGFLVRAWGVKTPELLLHVAACGVDGATVNWPEQAAELLGRADGKQARRDEAGSRAQL
ncbi:glycerophosphodiester phosphodiesterase [Raphidocelis subcapitata]|uniref:glycerophosphodiester phosphodiesterase n=1 Tax=Raphidocelis subcapitata TaxID=307507 RepID=A0A2V0PK76_9CHLO|nr:glycerophosphodiester phosphodiesterase [Raphidocelis subcapitata]|eukprot:GBG00212.1 glycerophosphodiester phosphodiesterase [Raphidocelis subcapitata]